MFRYNCKITLLSFFFIHNLAAGEDLFRNEHDMLKGDLLFDTTIKNVEIFQDFDFNGDGLIDVVAASKDHELAEPIEILINKPPSQDFHLRYGVELNTTLIQNSRPYRTLILSQASGNRESLVLAADGGQIEYIQYVDDPNLSIYDRYAVHSYSLFVEGSEISNPFKRIYHAGFGDAVFEDATIGNDLFVIADDDFDTRLFLFERPFDELKKTPQTLSPLASYELPGAPSHFWIGDIEKDEQQKDDVFFAYDDAWEIWLASRGQKGYEPDNEERSFRFAIPEGVTKITDIVGGEDVYDLVAGVETEAGGDIAYIVFQKEWTTSSRFIYRAVPVAIPDKHLQGGETRIFHYENKITGESHPVCIVYNRLDPQNLQANVFSIYKIDFSDPLTPQLAQTFVPEYVNDRGPYYFDRPELIGDFDNDGVSDIVMTAMQNDPSGIYHKILGFKGIGSETGVSRWRLFE